jgi:hypothetical protein
MSADPLTLTLRRWGAARRARSSVEAAQTLAQRLDDKGCAYGRETKTRLEELSRAHDRLESKLNAVLLGVVATFASTMVGMLVQALRGGG